MRFQFRLNSLDLKDQFAAGGARGKGKEGVEKEGKWTDTPRTKRLSTASSVHFCFRASCVFSFDLNAGSVKRCLTRICDCCLLGVRLTSLNVGRRAAEHDLPGPRRQLHVPRPHLRRRWQSCTSPRHCNQGRISHSGAPYQRKAGALYSYA